MSDNKQVILLRFKYKFPDERYYPSMHLVIHSYIAAQHTGITHPHAFMSTRLCLLSIYIGTVLNSATEHWFPPYQDTVIMFHTRGQAKMYRYGLMKIKISASQTQDKLAMRFSSLHRTRVIQSSKPTRPNFRLSTSALRPLHTNLTVDKHQYETFNLEQPIVTAIAVAAAVVVSSAVPSVAFAEEIYSAGPSQYRYPAAERYSEQQQSRFDEYLQTSELRALLDMLQGNPSPSDLDQARLKVITKEAFGMHNHAAHARLS